MAAFNPSGGPSSCSYVTLENLILDGLDIAGETVRVDPETIYSNPDTGHCKYVNVNGGTIRHGKFTAGLALVGSYWTFTNVEFTENGTQTTSGYYDHAIYLQGIRNKFDRRPHPSQHAGGPVLERVHQRPGIQGLQ